MVDNRTLLKEIIAVSLTAIGWGILPSLAVGMLLGLLSMNTATLLDTRFIILIGFVAQFLGAYLMWQRHKSQLQMIKFSTKVAFKTCVLGSLIGLSAVLINWGIITLLGGYKLIFNYQWSYLPVFFLFLIGYTIQAIAEELICRGYLMGYWLKKKRVVFAFLTNSILYVFLHVVNAGFDVYAALSLFLFSVLMSEIRLISCNIWLCSAINAAWHFSEGIIFGTVISGFPAIRLFITSTPTSNTQWLNGGVFGIERGAISIMLLILLIMIVVRLHKHHLKSLPQKLG